MPDSLFRKAMRSASNWLTVLLLLPLLVLLVLLLGLPLLLPLLLLLLLLLAGGFESAMEAKPWEGEADVHAAATAAEPVGPVE